MSDHQINAAHLTSRDAIPQSPFLPGTKIQYAWDSTSLGYFKTCPRLYQYQIIEGWQPRGESVHLRFGQEYHTAIEDYAKSRAADIPHDDAIHDTIRELLIRTWDHDTGKPWTTDPDTKAGKYKNRWSLVRLVIDYLDKFRDDPAKTFILQDGRAAVELSFRFELDWGPRAGEKPALMVETDGGSDMRPGGITNVSTTGEGMELVSQSAQPYILCGHLDKVVDFNGDLYVEDHKTSTTTPGSYFFNQFEPNNQMTLYTLAAQVVLASPIKGVIIDAAQILVDSSAFARGFTYRTQDQLEEWTNDLQYHLSIAESYATEGYWPMNDTACDKFGGCRFRTICSKSPRVRGEFLRADFDQLPEDERWNPLKPR